MTGNGEAVGQAEEPQFLSMPDVADALGSTSTKISYCPGVGAPML